MLCLPYNSSTISVRAFTSRPAEAWRDLVLKHLIVNFRVCARIAARAAGKGRKERGWSGRCRGWGAGQLGFGDFYTRVLISLPAAKSPFRRARPAGRDR